jgi:hypothetical protein
MPLTMIHHGGWHIKGMSSADWMAQHCQIDGKLLKPYLPSQYGDILMARERDPGYGNNDKDATMDNPQPSRYEPMGA